MRTVATTPGIGVIHGNRTGDRLACAHIWGDARNFAHMGGCHPVQEIQEICTASAVSTVSGVSAVNIVGAV